MGKADSAQRDSQSKDMEYARLHTCAHCHRHPGGDDDLRLDGPGDELLFCSQECQNAYWNEVEG